MEKEPDQRKPFVKWADEGTWISWMGGPAQFQALGTETDGTYCLSRAESNPGGGAPPHRHDFEEGFYLLKGRMEVVAGNQKTTIGEGQFVNVGSNVGHSLHNESGEKAEMLIIAAPAGFDQFQMEGGIVVDGADGPFPPVDDETRARILAAAERHGIDMSPPASAFEESPRATVTREGEGLIIDTVGDRYRFLATGKETAGKYALWEATISPGGGPPPHIHSREEEGFYVLEGELTFYTEEKSFRAGPGTLVGLPKHSLHWFRNETDKSVRALIFVAPAGFEEMFLETGLEISDATLPISSPDPAEKGRILEAAPKYGITILPPQKEH